MRAVPDLILGKMVMHEHAGTSISWESVEGGPLGHLDASTGTQAVPIAEPTAPDLTGASVFTWLVTEPGWLTDGENTYYVAMGDFLVWDYDDTAHYLYHTGVRRLEDTISEDTEVEYAVHAGEKLTSITMYNDGEGGATIKIGTTDGGTEIYTGAIGSDELLTIDIGAVYSMSDPQSVFFTSLNWGGASIWYVIMKELIYEP